jgi:hypothetical protein
MQRFSGIDIYLHVFIHKAITKSISVIAFIREAHNKAHPKLFNVGQLT